MLCIVMKLASDPNNPVPVPARLLNYIVAIYLIVIGVIDLVGMK